MSPRFSAQGGGQKISSLTLLARTQMKVFIWFLIKIVSEYDQEIPQSQTADHPLGIARKSRSTITRHQEEKLSKAISSLFPIKMIAILEWT